MAVEGALGTPSGMFVRRLKERVSVWRRLFLQNWGLFKASRIGVIGLAIMIGFVVLALAAPFMGLRDPIRWNAPDEDLIKVDVFWYKDSAASGSELRRAPPINQPIAFRVAADSFDARADRLYVSAGDRLYSFITYEPQSADKDPPSLNPGDNVWGAGRYFNVSADGTNRTISVPPLVLNFGDYVADLRDYEIYLGTDDGALFILRDPGGVLPTGSLVTRMNLDGPITGLAAFNGDMTAWPAIRGDPNHLFLNGSTGRWLNEKIGGQGDEGEHTSLALSPTDQVYIGYYDVSSGQPRVVERSGTANSWLLRSWEPFSLTDNVGQYTSLAVGSDGVPRIAYYDETDGALKYAAWNGSAFVPSRVDFIGDVGQYASLALNATTNEPRIAYYNATTMELNYVEQNGGNWSAPEVVPNPGIDAGQYASLALDATGRPHIAYYDATNGSLLYASKLVTWTVESVDADGDVGRHASIAVDQLTGQVHVSYYNSTNGSLKYATRTVAWSTPEVVDAAANVGQYTSIALNSTRNPSIAYHDATNLDLKFATWNPSTFTWETQTLLSEGHVGLYNSLKFDSTDRPHIAHYSFETGRTTRDIVVAGTATGTLYAIDVGIPSLIQRLAREKRVTLWDYRIRWVSDLGSEVHVAGQPLASVTRVPLYSPAFNQNGTAVFVGTRDGQLISNRTADGFSFWLEPDGITPRVLDIGNPWTSAPVVQFAAEGPENGKEIVYAGSNFIDSNDPDSTPDISLLHARLALSGDFLPQWHDQFPLYDAFPVGENLLTADEGNLTQPTVEGGTIYVGSTSGRLYAIRRDGVGALPPASIKWKYRDPSLLGLKPEFTSPALTISDKGILLVAANHNNGTASDSDDRGILYSFELSGGVSPGSDVARPSWKKNFFSRIPGSPVSWTAPHSLDESVWIAYGGDAISGLTALRSTGEFLAPSPPSWVQRYPSGNQYWLGLDSQGRDIFSQVIWGSRIALLVGFLSAFFTVILGLMVGLIAGYVGGKVEAILMRFTDVILVLPGLPLIITLAAVLGASIWNIILVISLLGWPGIARIIRAEVLSLKERPFIDSARVTGASTTRIVFKHIAPNVMPLAFLYMTFSVSGAILTEAALSFIGLGDINTMSWGIMLQLVSQSQALTAWWWLLPPGLAITLISLAFFLVGRAFDEIVNPRLRKR